ncbi:MAG: undecaprenyl-diphosphate phosphatase [Ferrimicrobium sp.]
MKPLIVAVLAGIVQGIVEWLPVSSKSIIGITFVAAGGYSSSTAYVMGLLANFGSFFAALYFFRRDIMDALKGLRRPLAKTVEAAKLRYLVIATAGTAIVGLPLYALVVKAFTKQAGSIFMIVIGLLLLATTVVNLQRERMARGRSVSGTEEVPRAGSAVIVGAAQGLAALPGVSRSAVTVTPLLYLGETPAAALRFSFLLDVVGLLGAGLAPFLVGHAGFTALRTVGVVPVVVMLVVASVVSFLAIGSILRLAARMRASMVTLSIGLLTLGGGVLYASGALGH